MNIERPRASTAQTHAQGRVASGPFDVFQQIPDMLNGDVTTFHQIHIATGINQAYYWPDDAACNAFTNITDDATLKACILQEANLYCIRLDNVITDDDKRCIVSVLLALFRAAARRAWGFKEANIEVSQKLTIDADRIPDDKGVIKAGIIGYPLPAKVKGEWTRCEKWYDDNIDVLLKRLMKVAAATPVCNGVVLVATQVHHFVDPHKNVMRVLTRQAWGGEDFAIAGLDNASYEDVAYHKAFHPIKAGNLMYLARDTETKARLSSIGMASGGVRTPALFQPERALSAFKALVQQTNELGMEYNLNLGAQDVVNAIDAITLPNPITAMSLTELGDDVNSFVAANGYSLAFCGGLMEAVAADLPRTLGRMSILQSHAVRRIMRENPVAVTSGENHYRLVKRWSRARANEGLLPGVGLFGAPVPADRGNPAP